MSAPFDILVVGGGPGGSAAAAAALRRGHSVAQVDRFVFPRVKPCGGGLTIKSCNAAPYDLSPMLRGESRAVDFNVWQTRHNRFTRRGSSLVRMVARPDFDHWLVSKNAERPGFRFLGGERVLDISYDGVFSVRTTSRTLRARQLVGADGAYSIVNRLFRVTQPKGLATAVEVVLHRDVATLPDAAPPCFDFGAIDRGYGWIFPKDDHWNVGLYTIAKQTDLRGKLAEYIRLKGFRVSGDPLATFQAHRFPYGGYRVTVPRAPVFVVGDAGGFGDPLLGEGIYHAIESGRIAGETAADCLAGRANPGAYYERLKPTVLTDTFITYYASKLFYRDVDEGLAILENPFIWRPFFEGGADGASFARSLARAWWSLPKSLVRPRFRHRRSGRSRPLALAGPLRGLAYLCGAIVDRADWISGPIP